MVELAKKNDKIVAITASMKDGTGLTKFAKEFPDRFFDIGIAEQHALGLAKRNGKRGSYTSSSYIFIFYQRAYDQVIHDIAIQNLPVIMCVDRAGVVGADRRNTSRASGYGIFRLIPNLTIMAPKDFKELEDMMEFAVNVGKPVVIRYPRGGEGKEKFNQHKR